MYGGMVNVESLAGIFPAACGVNSLRERVHTQEP